MKFSSIVDFNYYFIMDKEINAVKLILRLGLYG